MHDCLPEEGFDGKMGFVWVYAGYMTYAVKGNDNWTKVMTKKEVSDEDGEYDKAMDSEVGECDEMEEEQEGYEETKNYD